MRLSDIWLGSVSWKLPSFSVVQTDPTTTVAKSSKIMAALCLKGYTVASRVISCTPMNGMIWLTKADDFPSFGTISLSTFKISMFHFHLYQAASKWITWLDLIDWMEKMEHTNKLVDMSISTIIKMSDINLNKWCWLIKK